MKFEFPKQEYVIEYSKRWCMGWARKVFYSKTEAIREARKLRRTHTNVSVESMGMRYYL